MLPTNKVLEETLPSQAMCRTARCSEAYKVWRGEPVVRYAVKSCEGTTLSYEGMKNIPMMRLILYEVVGNVQYRNTLKMRRVIVS